MVIFNPKIYHMKRVPFFTVALAALLSSAALQAQTTPDHTTAWTEDELKTGPMAGQPLVSSVTPKGVAPRTDALSALFPAGDYEALLLPAPPSACFRRLLVSPPDSTSFGLPRLTFVH